jgi:CRP/FNR family cyclic AMP-dependent transcriptional regulator
MTDKFNVADIAEFCGRAELVSVKPGEFLFREGEEGQAFYIVQKGTLRIVSGSTVYETVKTGDIVGEMAILNEGAPRSASVIAGTYSELLEIGKERFLSLVSNNPNFALDVMRVMARRLRIMNQRERRGSPTIHT